MKEQVICSDGKFSAGWVSWAKEVGVKPPQQDKIYTVRDVVKHSNGGVGLLLEELNNPMVDLGWLLAGHIQEPTFSIGRFRTLMGEPLNLTEVEAEDFKLQNISL